MGNNSFFFFLHVHTRREKGREKGNEKQLLICVQEHVER
jgi:hypothetical protein